MQVGKERGVEVRWFEIETTGLNVRQATERIWGLLSNGAKGHSLKDLYITS